MAPPEMSTPLSEHLRMPAPHPLNVAVIAQALQAMRDGQLRRCQSMGFTPRALAALKQPATVSVLANASVSWCTVKVNPEILHRLLNQVSEVEREIETIDRMLALGASTEMVSEFWGLTHQEVALRRQMLGLPLRKGRWTVLTEEQDVQLYHLWSEGIKDRRIDVEDDAAMLALAMDLAARQGIALTLVWGSIQSWITDRQQKVT